MGASATTLDAHTGRERRLAYPTSVAPQQRGSSSTALLPAFLHLARRCYTGLRRRRLRRLMAYRRTTQQHSLSARRVCVCVCTTRAAHVRFSSQLAGTGMAASLSSTWAVARPVTSSPARRAQRGRRSLRVAAAADDKLVLPELVIPRGLYCEDTMRAKRRTTRCVHLRLHLHISHPSPKGSARPPPPPVPPTASAASRGVG